jgi:uncharacterized protein
VALIVKADDVGVALAKGSNPVLKGIGHGLVAGMPPTLKVLSVVGTLAMLWVGGGIILHGAHELGLHWPEDLMHHLAEMGGGGVAVAAGFPSWLIGASIAGLFGIVVGWITERIVHLVRGKGH